MSSAPQSGDWGERLRLAREEALLSQSELADKLDVHRGTVSRWERGEQMPHVRHLRRLAKATGRPVSYFLAPLVTTLPL